MPQPWPSFEPCLRILQASVGNGPLPRLLERLYCRNLKRRIPNVSLSRSLFSLRPVTVTQPAGTSIFIPGSHRVNTSGCHSQERMEKGKWANHSKMEGFSEWWGYRFCDWLEWAALGWLTWWIWLLRMYFAICVWLFPAQIQPIFKRVSFCSPTNTGRLYIKLPQSDAPTRI